MPHPSTETNPRRVRAGVRIPGKQSAGRLNECRKHQSRRMNMNCKRMQSKRTFSCSNEIRALMVLSVGCGLAALGMARAQGPAATETVVHAFETSAPRGMYPYAGVIRDSAGNLYGTTWEGGTGGAGLVYKLDRSGHQTVLYS